MIGLCLRRPLRFVAKIELFDKRWKAWLLLALGAFPIRRGDSDEDAMETARMILEQGGAVGIFPEGTRVRPGPLGEPKRGVGRLELETGAPIVPAAIIGTENIRKGLADPSAPRNHPLRPGAHVSAARSTGTSPGDRARDRESRLVLRLPSVGVARRAAARPDAIVVGAGSWGTAVATLLARGGASVQLVCRTERQARELGRCERTSPTSPGSCSRTA